MKDKAVEVLVNAVLSILAVLATSFLVSWAVFDWKWGILSFAIVGAIGLMVTLLHEWWGCRHLARELRQETKESDPGAGS